MSTACKQGERCVQDALHGTLGEADQRWLDGHAATCPHCAAALRESRAVLDLMAVRIRPEPPPVFWNGYYERLQARMARTEKPVWARFHTTVQERWAVWFPPVPRLAWQLAFTLALIAVGIGLGRTLFSPANVPPSVAEEQPLPAIPDILPPTLPETPLVVTPAIAATSPAMLPKATTRTEHRPLQGQPLGASPALVPASVEARTWQYLDRSKVLLLGIVNTEPTAPDAAVLNLPRKQALARDLVAEAGRLQTELNTPAQQRMNDLVRDLEVILLQIANLEATHDLPAIEMVRSGVERRGILFKINLEAMQRTRAATPPPSDL
jgi:hypothetical protein